MPFLVNSFVFGGAGAQVASLSIDSIGPQASSGNVPVTYTIDFTDSTVEAVVFAAASADPAAADFNTGATSGYIDIGQVALTSDGSGIALSGPDGLDGSYKLAWLPTGGGDSDVAVSAAFTLDSLAPVLSSPTVVGAQTGETTAQATVVSDEAAGTLYAAVYPTASTPSAADIIAGTGAVYTDTDATPTAGTNTFNATGLTASTAYKWHFVQDDAFSNRSNVSTTAEFTTDAEAAPGAVSETYVARSSELNWDSTDTGTIDLTGVSEGDVLYFAVTCTGGVQSADITAIDIEGATCSNVVKSSTTSSRGKAQIWKVTANAAMAGNAAAVIDPTGSCGDGYADFWKITGTVNTETGTANQDTSAASSLASNTATVSGGVLLTAAFAEDNGGVPTVTWTGATKISDVLNSNGQITSSASASSLSTETRSISVALTNNDHSAIAVVALS